jgi:predicted Zn-dependent protease with MMP-like domain
MQIPSDKEFDNMISDAMKTLPARDIDNLQNVVITYADEPSEYQRDKLKLRGDSLLLGLYEGIPLTQRGAGYNLVLPDKITLFKKPLVHYSNIRNTRLEEEIRHTLWHEIAHFYGLNHQEIHKREI